MRRMTVLSATSSWGNLIAIKSSDVDRVWDKCVPMINRALARQKNHDLFSVKRLVSSGSAQLWVIVKDKKISSVIITEVIIYPLRKGLRFFLCGGKNAYDCKPALEIIEAWGKSIGCKHSEILGRKGWARLLGFDVTMHLMEKEYVRGRRR